MKQIIGLAVIIGTVFGAAPSAQSADGPWMVRGRLVEFQPANAQDPALGVVVEDKAFPEVDITYFFSKNIAAELILTYPQTRGVTVNGTNIGSVKALPPTLTVQYHFRPDAIFRPYVGVGVNYTLFSSVNLAGGAIDIDRSSVGPSFQVGWDVKMENAWFLNFDIKKIYVKTDVKDAATGNKLTTLHIDPVVIGFGVGYRF